MTYLSLLGLDVAPSLTREVAGESSGQSLVALLIPSC